jgi:hypothetical protein
MYKPRKVSELLTSGAPRLQHLARRAKAALALREQVQAALPAQLAPHITGAVQRQQDLILSVDSPAFCARLRFEAPRLRAALGLSTGLPIGRISVRVLPQR